MAKAEPATHADESERTAGAAAVMNRKARQILNAAAELFLKKGFESVSMDSVAASAGVSKATLYAHFANKKELFVAVVAEETQRILEQIWEPRGSAQGVESVLRSVAANFIQVFLADRTVAFKRAVTGALPHFNDVGAVVFAAGPAKMTAMLAGFLKTAPASERLVIEDPERAARQFMNLTCGEFELGGALWMPRPSQDAVERTIDAAIEMFMARYRRG